MKRLVALWITTIAGLALVASAFIPATRAWGETVATWFSILASVAFILGGGNLLKIHLRRLSDRPAGWGYSAVILIGFFVTLWVGLFKVGVHPNPMYPDVAYSGETQGVGSPFWWLYEYAFKPLTSTMFALLAFMSRGYFPTVSGYQIEGIRLGGQTGVNWRQITVTMLVAIAFGAASALIFHLQPYYHEGGIGLRGGIWGSGIAQQEYTNVLRGIAFPGPPDVPRIIATSAGGLLIALLSAARSYWFGFPFHPIGYGVACAYGSLVWAPFLIVWIVKTVLLRYGGSQSYLRALPGFLGFALGHFITAGLIWGSLASVLGGPFLRWGVWFG